MYCTDPVTGALYLSHFTCIWIEGKGEGVMSKERKREREREGEREREKDRGDLSRKSLQTADPYCFLY